jgi:putative addiction module killer protein
MIEVQTLTIFDEWLDGLKDRTGKARIIDRIDRARDGNLGRVRALANGLSEMKVDYGPGYRVYFTKRGETIVVLMCGGDKSSQQSDMKRATAILEALKAKWKTST